MPYSTAPWRQNASWCQSWAGHRIGKAQCDRDENQWNSWNSDSRSRNRSTREDNVASVVAHLQALRSQHGPPALQALAADGDEGRPPADLYRGSDAWERTQRNNNLAREQVVDPAEGLVQLGTMSGKLGTTERQALENTDLVGEL